MDVDEPEVSLFPFKRYSQEFYRALFQYYCCNARQSTTSTFPEIESDAPSEPTSFPINLDPSVPDHDYESNLRREGKFGVPWWTVVEAYVRHTFEGKKNTRSKSLNGKKFDTREEAEMRIASHDDGNLYDVVEKEELVEEKDGKADGKEEKKVNEAKESDDIDGGLKNEKADPENEKSTKTKKVFRIVDRPKEVHFTNDMSRTNHLLFDGQGRFAQLGDPLYASKASKCKTIPLYGLIC